MTPPGEGGVVMKDHDENWKIHERHHDRKKGL